ncbi:MAG: RibD family protein [Spirochaeta sp.]
MSSLPRFTVTFAQSIDGCIATVTGDSQWISGSETLDLAHSLRAGSDAIMVGIGTVFADDPMLTCRRVPGSSPIRVILDSNARIPVESQLVQSAGDVPTVLCVRSDLAESHTHEHLATLSRHGVTLLYASANGEQLDLHDIRDQLGQMGIGSILVEGGCRLITSLFRQRMVDELVLVSAPILIGRGRSAVGDLGLRQLSDALRGKTISLERYGEDIVWRMRFES